MFNYRRYFIPGDTWFFTVNLLQGQNNNLNDIFGNMP